MLKSPGKAVLKALAALDFKRGKGSLLLDSMLHIADLPSWTQMERVNIQRIGP